MYTWRLALRDFIVSTRRRGEESSALNSEHTRTRGQDTCRRGFSTTAARRDGGDNAERPRKRRAGEPSFARRWIPFSAVSQRENEGERVGLTVAPDFCEWNLG